MLTAQCPGLAGNEGPGTGLGKLWVTEAWPLTSMQELQGEAGGGRGLLGLPRGQRVQALPSESPAPDGPT